MSHEPIPHPAADRADDPSDAQRRAVLQLTAGLAAAAPLLAQAQATPSALPPLPPPPPTGRPGDFDFLTGQWLIHNRQWKNGAWDTFEGEATVHGLLGGVCSVEELRIPARHFSGMGLRLLDVQRQLWADHWVNSRSGVLVPPPSWGSFVDGVGLWDSEDEDNGQPIVVRCCWDRITPRSCRWYQAISRDRGLNWQNTWEMDWRRA